MIDQSQAIRQKCDKVVYVRIKGDLMIVSDGKNEQGKWRTIDLCFGNTREAVQDLQAQGYEVKQF